MSDGCFPRVFVQTLVVQRPAEVSTEVRTPVYGYRLVCGFAFDSVRIIVVDYTLLEDNRTNCFLFPCLTYESGVLNWK